MNATIERIRNEAKALSPDERELLLVTLDCDLHGCRGGEPGIRRMAPEL